MKHKKLVQNLILAQKWYDAQPQKFKDATTRPGSIKQRIVVGK